MILECLRYWVNQPTASMASGLIWRLILGRNEDGTAHEQAAAAADPGLSTPSLGNVKLIAEAWDAGGLYQVGSFPAWRTAGPSGTGAYRDDAARLPRRATAGSLRDAAMQRIRLRHLHGGCYSATSGQLCRSQCLVSTSSPATTALPCMTCTPTMPQAQRGERLEQHRRIRTTTAAGTAESEGETADPAVLSLRYRHHPQCLRRAAVQPRDANVPRRG